MIEKTTVNLIVPDISACLPFWRDRLGFQVTVEVPHGDGVGFVILERDGTSVMLQSQASLAEDVQAIAGRPYRSVLYVSVRDLTPIRQALRDWPQVCAERTTFYGARELIVEDPAGNVVFFAAH